MDPVSYMPIPTPSASASASAAGEQQEQQDLTVNAFTDDITSQTIIQITPPATAPKQPSLFICVLDVSGSMGSSADGKPTGESPDALFSRLDLVKHSINTLIQGVEDDDYIALVPFNGTASLTLPATQMTQNGREHATSAVGRMEADGGTNIWAGLEIAINHAAQNKHKNPLILLLTDGEPNIDPPRGLVGTIQQTLQAIGYHVPIHTFGFGYDMNSKLINSVAEATQATYAFIPDCSMVGTVFINFIATALASIAHYMTLTDPDGTTYNLSGIQAGQTRTIPLGKLLENTSDVDKKYILRLGSAGTAKGYGLRPTPASEDVKFANQWLNALISAYGHASAINLEEAREVLAPLASTAPPPYLSDLISISSDDGAGQIGKAMEKLAWWQRWGRHYLPSVISAHRNQVCNNFKDQAIQGFGGEAFRTHQARLEKIFLSIPPPACSIAPIASRSYYGNGSASATYSSVTPVDMSAYLNAGGGCFSGLNKVNTPGGSRLVRDVKKGDILTTVLPDGSEGKAKVICSVVSKPPGGTMDLVSIAGLKITPWHPMKMVANEPTWHFPGDLVKAIDHRAEEPIDEVYTFVMEEGHVVIVEGFPVCCLGHGFKGAVIEHAYFGTQAIIDDLKQLDGWDDGSVLYNDLKKLAANKYSCPATTVVAAEGDLTPASYTLPEPTPATPVVAAPLNTSDVRQPESASFDVRSTCCLM
jgi:Mg-chelatase subunit ChlD